MEYVICGCASKWANLRPTLWWLVWGDGNPKCWDNPMQLEFFGEKLTPQWWYAKPSPKFCLSLDCKFWSTQIPTWPSFYEADLNILVHFCFIKDAGWLQLWSLGFFSPHCWDLHLRQGNCTFNSYVVEIQAMNGGWSRNPPGCTDLTQDSQTSCYLNLILHGALWDYHLTENCPFHNAMDNCPYWINYGDVP